MEKLRLLNQKIKSIYLQMASLRWKLFFSFLALSLIPLLFYAATALRTVDRAYTEERRRDLLSYANRIATTIVTENFLTLEGPPWVGFMFEYYINNQRELTSYRIVVVDYTGLVLMDSHSPYVRHWREQNITLLTPDIIYALDRRSAWSEHAEHMNVAVPIISRDASPEGSDLAGVVLVQASTLDKNLLIAEMEQNLLLLTVFLIIIILILVFFISQLIIEPLNNILSAVKKITDGRLDERVKFYGHDEFSELGQSFNNMTEQLSRIDEARSEFVANVSHELKTPLSSIKILGESLLLQETADIELFKEFLTDINSEVDRMTKIVNDLLALVLLDRKEQFVLTVPFKLNGVLEDICHRLKPLADQKNIGLYLYDKAAVTVKGDEMKLYLALSNIIENGIKYTNNDGDVRITVDQDSQNAIISITDTGVGIDEAEHKKIFDRFYRVDKTRDRETGGTGLGLSIAHKAILLSGGTIRLSSKEGAGSEFVVRLPLYVR